MVPIIIPSQLTPERMLSGVTRVRNIAGTALDWLTGVNLNPMADRLLSAPEEEVGLSGLTQSRLNELTKLLPQDVSTVNALTDDSSNASKETSMPNKPAESEMTQGDKSIIIDALLTPLALIASSVNVLFNKADPLISRTKREFQVLSEFMPKLMGAAGQGKLAIPALIATMTSLAAPSHARVLMNFLRNFIVLHPKGEPLLDVLERPVQPPHSLDLAVKLAGEVPGDLVLQPARSSLVAMFLILIKAESSDKVDAVNPTSGAYGLVQILPSIAASLKKLYPELPPNLKDSPEWYQAYARMYFRDLYKSVLPRMDRDNITDPILDAISDRSWRNIGRILYAQRAGGFTDPMRQPEWAVDAYIRFAVTAYHNVALQSQLVDNTGS